MFSRTWHKKLVFQNVNILGYERLSGKISQALEYGR
jgi:hypothetical protein